MKKAIAGIIGLATNLRRRLRHSLTSSQSHLHETQFKDKKWIKSTGFRTVKCGTAYNPNAFDASEWGNPNLGNIMEALADPHTHLIGVYGSDDKIKDDLLEKVGRRVQRGNMFDKVVRASIPKNPDRGKIQENIASQLGLTFNHRSKDNRAQELIRRIKNEQTILIVFRGVYKGFELSKVGIPYGADHTGCKVLLTSKSEDVLSNHIHTQQNFRV